MSTTNSSKLVVSKLTQYNKMILTNIASSLGCNIQVHANKESSIVLLVSKNGNPKLYAYVQVGIIYALNTQCLVASSISAFTVACHALYEQERRSN